MIPSERPTPLTATAFTDRVMTAISLVPAPTPTRAFVAAMKSRALRDAAAALWVAWHLGTVRTWHVAPPVRARSFALVLAVTSVLATSSLVAAAAVQSVVPRHDDPNPVMAPSGSSVDLGPWVKGQTTNEIPNSSEAPEPTDDDVGTTIHKPTSTDIQDPTEGVQTEPADHNDGAGDGDASDGAQDGSDGGDQPAATEDPSGGDEPTQTDTPNEEPTATDGSSTDSPGDDSEPDSTSDGSGG